MGNGNGWVTKWLVGALWAALVSVIIFMGNVVKANDVKVAAEHVAMRKEIVEGDEKVLQKVEKKIDEIVREQVALKIQSAQILETVKFLKEKAK